MDILKIPFVQKVGIIQSTSGSFFELPYVHDVQNHLKTIHASAQFTLAETASGDFLQSLLPELNGKIIAVLRESKTKFKNPAKKNIIAHPSISDESEMKFRELFSKKGRASILVDVEIKDIDGMVTCIASFNWFLQILEK